MKTACWTTYTGRGRILLAKPDETVPRGYRLAPALLYVGRARRTTAEVWTALALADACAVWRELHRISYPFEPVICTAAPAGVESYRVLVARWLAAHTEEVPELENPETHEAIKVRRPTLYGLRPAIQPAEPATETA